MMRHGVGGGASARFSPHCCENRSLPPSEATGHFHEWVVPRMGMGNSGVGQSPPGSIRSWGEYLEPMEPPRGYTNGATNAAGTICARPGCRHGAVDRPPAFTLSGGD